MNTFANIRLASESETDGGCRETANQSLGKIDKQLSRGFVGLAIVLWASPLIDHARNRKGVLVDIYGFADVLAAPVQAGAVRSRSTMS